MCPLSITGQLFLNVLIVNMGTMWLSLLMLSVQQTLADNKFGSPYISTNVQLCRDWNCINRKLGLPNSLPPREQSDITLRSLLPDGEWQEIVDKVLDTCYNARQRTYTNTCPGQALFHCVVDNLIENCPESSLRKDDACSPLSSIAGLKYMFSQSLYEGLEKNLPKERRPAWFLKNYFDSKCCNLPELFNTSVLTECGFRTVVNYYKHTPQPKHVPSSTIKKPIFPVSIHINWFSNKVKIVNSDESMTTTPSMDTLRIVNLTDIVDINSQDPLDCCDMESFIKPDWRSECDFKLTWDGQNRLAIANSTRGDSTVLTTTTTQSPLPRYKDVKIVPLSCEKEICVFNKLGVSNEAGNVSIDSFIKLLDNFTDAHADWSKAKARVITECINKPLQGYEADCQINKVLMCVMDLLSENCPHVDKKHDPCKNPKPGMICQISSAKYRPKNRRSVCSLPNLVPKDVLSECGLTSLSRMEYVPERTTNKGWAKIRCQDATESTTCLMNKMGVLNKYNFMDYFKMKDRIRHFTAEESDWSVLTDVYLSAFTNMAMYRTHCNSPKKLLNVIDAMLMTCPISRRKHTQQCDHIFTDLINVTPASNSQEVSKAKIRQLMNRFEKVFLPEHPVHRPLILTASEKSKLKEHYKPLYNFGMLASGDIPKVKFIDVKRVQNKPLVVLPVYMQVPRYPTSVSTIPYRSSLLRSATPLSQNLSMSTVGPAKP